MKHLTKYVPNVALRSAANLGAIEPSASDPYICHGWADDDDDYEDVEGSVMGGGGGGGGGYGVVRGSVMGARMRTSGGGGMEVVGYDDDGTPLVVGTRAGTRGIRVRKPGWRKTQLAPGVIAPDEGMLPLPLTGSTGTNTFTAALATITFLGQLQKPFRGERLLVSTTRTGVTATSRLVSQLFVGTDLQQLDVPGFDAEQVGTPTAFGVRLTMKPAQPGVFIRLITTLSAVLTGTDTILTTVTLLGRLVH